MCCLLKLVFLKNPFIIEENQFVNYLDMQIQGDCQLKWAVFLSVLAGRRRHAIKEYAILRSRWRSTGVVLPQEVVELQSLGVRS